jgi:hypothetical protein
MKKIFWITLLFSTISCTKVGDLSQDALLSLGLLNYRSNVTIDGSFYGIYNANVKAVSLGADGKCDQLSAGNGSSDTDSKGKFNLSYKRFSDSQGNVCLIAYPKEDGTSRFFAVDQQKEITWVGQNNFQVLIMPEPSSTTRSAFSVISTPFNRMASRRLERLAKGNTDPSKTAEHLKTANRQIVSQFGLSRGLSKSMSRASSLELATPELTSIPIDFSNPSDPTTLKFTVMIGGLHKLAIPEKPDTYNDVVKVVSEYLSSGTGNSVGEDGKPILLPKDEPANGGSGKPLSEGNSLSSQVAAAVNSFVADKAAELGIPAESIAAIAAQVVVQDKPAFGPTAPTSQSSAPSPTITYGGNSFIFTLGSNVSLNPSYSNVSFFMLRENKNEGVLPKGLSINETTGEISGVPEELTETSIKVKASGAGGEKVATLKIEIVPVPTININAPAYCNGNSGEMITCKYSTAGINLTPQVVGIESLTGMGSLPEGVIFEGGSIIGRTSRTCAPGDCTFTLNGTGKGGSTSVSIQFIETPSFTYPSAVYTYLPGDEISVQSQNIRATTSFALDTDSSLPAGLRLDANTGIISGSPLATNSVVTNTLIKASGIGGYTVIPVVFLRKPSFNFTSSDFIYSSGESFNFKPSSSAGVKRYSVYPDLPSGLTLNTTSGEVTGSLPAVGSDSAYETIYTVTAHGEMVGSEELNTATTIKLIQRPVLSYPDKYIGSAGERIEIIPSSKSAISTFSSSTLPAGLTLDTRTGIISGTLQTSLTASNYQINGTGTGGIALSTIRFIPKPTLGFSGNVFSLDLEEDIIIPPANVSGITEFFISPALPSWLIFNRFTGVISGKVGTGLTSTTYEITGTGEGGTSEKTTITLNMRNPYSVSCSRSQLSGSQGTALTTFRCNTSNRPGTTTPHIASDWRINGSLPQGLSVAKYQTYMEIQGTPSSISSGSLDISFRTAYGDSPALTVPYTISEINLQMTCSTNIITGTQGSAINSFSCSSNYPVSDWILSGSLPNGLFSQKSNTTLLIQGTPSSSFNGNISIYFTTPYANSSVANITMTIQQLTEVVFNFDDGIIPSGWTLESPNSSWFFRIISAGCYSGSCLGSGSTGGANSTQTYITYATNVPANGFISYQWKVSSESNYDFCRFFIDGANQINISGEVNYQEIKKPITPGSHVFKWAYTKDATVSGGADTCWLDEVKFIY